MAKRPADGDDGNLAYQKRQKMSTFSNISSPAVEISSAGQLKQLLAFDQESGRSKHGNTPDIIVD
jgi:nucleolar pre-ribosomal-associated protein 1